VTDIDAIRDRSNPDLIGDAMRLAHLTIDLEPTITMLIAPSRELLAAARARCQLGLKPVRKRGAI
jgi:hypothetical protein